MNDVTVCITSYQRAEYLDRAITSCLRAGVRRLTIGASAITPEVQLVINKHRADGWLSYDVRTTVHDVGCNSTWMLALYPARTKRVIVLHDDDQLTPAFGPAYATVIQPHLERTGGCASWRAHLYYDDGRVKPTEWLVPSGPTREITSGEMYLCVTNQARLSLSPVVSVLDRETTIQACKEAAKTLTDNRCILHPGMLLGTEILVYMRHIQKFRSWLFVDKVLALYGSHNGSGTIAAEKSGNLTPLLNGYNIARAQGFRKPAPAPSPTILFSYFDDGHPENPRYQAVRASWDHQFSNFNAVELPLDGFTRTCSRGLPYITDVLDRACTYALPEDVVVYCNRDIGLVTPFRERVLTGVDRGRGVTCCPRRNLRGEPGKLYHSVRNCHADGGFDLFAFTPRWWNDWGCSRMPDMFIGYEAWDTVFRVLAEEWADGAGPRHRVTDTMAEWDQSRVYTDDVIYHEAHLSMWQKEKLSSPANQFNRAQAHEFFTQRNTTEILPCLQ